MASKDSGRIVRGFTQHIEAPPQEVFRLLCPVREGEWLDGWAKVSELIHSQSGLAEDGCVFRTQVAGEPETIWMITRHDPAQGVVEFVRVTAGLVATRLAIQVEAAPGGSSVHIAYSFTPLGPEGRDYVARNHSEQAFTRSMGFWQDSMNHWLRTGETLRAAAH